MCGVVRVFIEYYTTAIHRTIQVIIQFMSWNVYCVIVCMILRTIQSLSLCPTASLGVPFRHHHLSECRFMLRTFLSHVCVKPHNITQLDPLIYSFEYCVGRIVLCTMYVENLAFMF